MYLIYIDSKIGFWPKKQVKAVVAITSKQHGQFHSVSLPWDGEHMGGGNVFPSI